MVAMNNNAEHVVITGGAGYIGSALVARMLRLGYKVTAIDSLLYGGESLIPFMADPNFQFSRQDINDPRCLKNALSTKWPKPKALFHLAGIVGFPACQAIGTQAAHHYNVIGTDNIVTQAQKSKIEKILYTSTYSVYGQHDHAELIDETSQATPESLYAETKLAAEEVIKEGDGTILRLATLFGTSPRTRFDLIVNQFVLDAFVKRELLIYQRGYTRSFIHVQDVLDGLILALNAERVNGKIYNLGCDTGTYTKDEVVQMVIKRLPDTFVEYKDLTFGGDRRDIAVSFAKIQDELGFTAKISVDDGVKEVVDALRWGMIREPNHIRYRNAQFMIS